MGKYYQEPNYIKTSTTVSLPIGTIGFITWLVFLILKLTQDPEWLTWFWVWFPFWLPWAIFGVELVIVIIIVVIAMIVDNL